MTPGTPALDHGSQSTEESSIDDSFAEDEPSYDNLIDGLGLEGELLCVADDFGLDLDAEPEKILRLYIFIERDPAWRRFAQRQLRELLLSSRHAVLPAVRLPARSGPRPRAARVRRIRRATARAGPDDSDPHLARSPARAGRLGVEAA